jgi:glyceraldehyde-3-phosphate dehydrogenase (NAD(P))
MRQAGLPVETIDAIRALTGLETDGARSVAKTDATLGVRKDLMAPVRA